MESCPSADASRRALGERRRDVDVVYASDLGRAVQTAEIAFRGTGVPVHLDRRLRECNYGELNGRPAPEIDAARRLRDLEEPFPGGQSYREVVQATRSFLADVVARHDGEEVLAIGHAANRWALQHLLEGTPLETLVDAPFEWQEGWLVRIDVSAAS